LTDVLFSSILYAEREAARCRIKELLIVLFTKNESIIWFKREKKKQEYIEVLTDSSILLPVADS